MYLSCVWTCSVHDVLLEICLCTGIEETHPTVTSFPVHAMPSFRQMSVPISELEIIKSAVFKIKWYAIIISIIAMHE